ncbi:MAG TPA: protein kinase [Anaerolineales bacterium]|nr:protein kinase [Anaerolineales bacterium]
MNQGPSWVGRTLSGRYKIEEMLGQGGMSALYKATHPTLKRAVAIKIFHAEVSNDLSSVWHFEIEAKQVAGLRHPNIVQIFDFGIAESHPYLVMEYLSGPTLATYLRNLHQKDQRIPTYQVARLLKSLTSALDYAHEQGVVHGDIKPRNILLSRKGTEIRISEPLTRDIDVILTDFGLLRIAHAEQSDPAIIMISGTPAYMSPEQALGDKTDHRTDIYSLGVVLYEMLAGRVPFESDSTPSIIYKHIKDPPPHIPGISPAVQNVLDRALAKDPNVRYQSSRDMAVDFYLAIGMTAQAETAYQGTRASAPDAETTGAQPPDNSVGKSATSPDMEDVESVPSSGDGALPHPSPPNESFFRSILRRVLGESAADPRTVKKYVEPKTGQPPSSSSEERTDTPVDEVSFTAYHRKEGQVDTWYTLLVYAHIASALRTVRTDAQKFAEEIGPPREITSKTSTPIARGTDITIIPTCSGVTFNPEQISFQWAEDYHRAHFRFKADPSLADAAANGQISIYAGPIIIGTLKFAMLFTETLTADGPEHEEQARMYLSNRIFISYSHKDTDFALMVRNVLRAVGYDVLIDIDDLRAGQVWNDELMRMIERADIFQLFWSSNFSQSEYCRREWEHALKQEKPEGFIRPIYWQKPLPPPPEELSKFHFDYVELKLPNL